MNNEKILDSIYPFCRNVRNKGTAMENGSSDYPERVKFLLSLLREYSIENFVDSFSLASEKDNSYHNIIIQGDSKYMVIAHHDVLNTESENANDNSASVINAIFLKLLVPGVHIVLTDCEELGLKGARRLGEQINKGIFGKIQSVLNLELTGLGGENFLMGQYHGPLSDKITKLFDPPMFRTPPSDSVALQSLGIDSNVINPLPILTEGTSPIQSWSGYLDNSSWSRCHRDNDTLEHISTKDMYEFVTKILVPIVT
jgi:hypothetical protein